jgi:Lipase 3 N-terminal region
MSPEDFEAARIYEQYAAAAYCGANNDPTSGIDTLTCDVGNCPEVGTAVIVPGSKFSK